MMFADWADRYRLLSGKSAAEPGNGKLLARRTSKGGDEPAFNQLARTAHCVHAAKGAQVGGTEAGNNWIGYIIHMAPGPMMAVSPTVELAA